MQTKPLVKETVTPLPLLKPDSKEEDRSIYQNPYVFGQFIPSSEEEIVRIRQLSGNSFLEKHDVDNSYLEHLNAEIKRSVDEDKSFCLTLIDFRALFENADTLDDSEIDMKRVFCSLVLERRLKLMLGSHVCFTQISQNRFALLISSVTQQSHIDDKIHNIANVLTAPIYKDGECNCLSVHMGASVSNNAKLPLDAHFEDASISLDVSIENNTLFACEDNRRVAD